MQDLNCVNLVGRLTRDMEVRYTNNNAPIGNFSLAVNRTKKEGDKYVDEGNFFDCTLFGKFAETMKPYLLKGKQVAISGSLKQDRWEKDGQKQSRVSIIVNNIQLVGGRDGSAQTDNAPTGGSPAPAQFDDGGFHEDVPWEGDIQF